MQVNRTFYSLSGTVVWGCAYIINDLGSRDVSSTSPMVAFVVTPWKSREELVRVRAQLWPDRIPDASGALPAAEAGPDPSRLWRVAADRIFMWTRRGGCPHVVESTARLVDAALTD